MVIWFMKKHRGKMWKGAVLTNLKRSLNYITKICTTCQKPHIQLKTSTLQPSLAKLSEVIRSKVVPSLSWFGVVTKTAYGPGKTDTRAMC
jgi:hypothetical protein